MSREGEEEIKEGRRPERTEKKEIGMKGRKELKEDGSRVGQGKRRKEEWQRWEEGWKKGEGKEGRKGSGKGRKELGTRSCSHLFVI